MIFFSKGPHYLLIFQDNTNYYRQIGFANLFNVAMLIAHVHMPCIFITDIVDYSLI